MGLGIQTRNRRFARSTALVVIDKLLTAGAEIKVYDPVAMAECKRKIGEKVTYCKDMYDAVFDADALAVLTEWKEFRVPSWSVMRKVMKHPVLIDGRNIYDKQEAIAEGSIIRESENKTTRNSKDRQSRQPQG